ncbi:MAG: hypothetical protein WCI60_01645 [bacterium]
MSKELEILKVKDVKNHTHKLDKTLNPVLPRHPFMECIIAPPRSGKTCFLMNKIFRLYPDDYFDEIIYVSPSQLHDNTCKELLPKKENLIQISETDDILNLDTLIGELIKSQKKLVKEEEPMKRIWLILDDCVSFLKPVAVLATRYRHAGLSISVVSQSFRSIPLLIRNCANVIIFFHLNSKRELEKMDEEYGSNYCSDFMELAEKYTKEKYNFLYLNNDKMEMYHNFTELIKDCS